MALSFQSEDIIHYTCRMAVGGIIFSVRGHYTLYMLDGRGWHYLFSQRTLYTIHVGWPWVALSFQSEDIIHYTCWMAIGGIILLELIFIIMLLYTCIYVAYFCI